jgi:CheY-like chemotaxis protein
VTDRLVDLLTRVDLIAIPAYSGEEAVERVKAAKKAREPIDLLLVDHMLPGIDGFETVRQIREQYPGLATMLMTGYSSADSAARAVDLGAVGYVLKPFTDVAELSERIKSQAMRCVAERRERRYLALIKQRHAQFLERYRKVSAELDSLSE